MDHLKNEIWILTVGICRILGLENPPSIVFKEPHRMITPAKGYYMIDKMKNTSSIELNIRSIISGKDLLELLTHELCHAFQNRSGGYYNDPNEIKLMAVVDEKIREDIQSYPINKRLKEIDARLFANKFLELVSDEQLRFVDLLLRRNKEE